MDTDKGIDKVTTASSPPGGVGRKLWPAVTSVARVNDAQEVGALETDTLNPVRNIAYDLKSCSFLLCVS